MGHIHRSSRVAGDAESLLADGRASEDVHLITDERETNNGIGADACSSTYGDAWADDDVRPNHRACADLRVGAYDSADADHNALLKARAGVNRWRARREPARLQ
jgi:hypothetical protein